MNKIEIIHVGEPSYPTNCYLIYDEMKKGIIIDPGFEASKIISKIKEKNVTVEKIIFTHCHADHICAVDDVKAYTGAKVYIHEEDLDGIDDTNKACFFHFPNENKPILSSKDVNVLKDNDVITVGDINLKVIHTPGHTSGCICLYEESMNVMFTGDTIFHNCYGRCDLPSSDIKKMGESLEKIFNNYSNIIIYPGHEEKANIDDIKKKIRLLYKIKNS